MKHKQRKSAKPVKPFACLPLLFFAAVIAIADTAIPEPDGYRMEDYDAPVPDGLSGATRVTALDVKKLQTEKNALVVDVIPEHRKPDFLPENQIWIPVPHKGLVGALWLPDVGFGALSEVTERYFRSHLEKATKGNVDHPVVFYCRIDCWMSCDSG